MGFRCRSCDEEHEGLPMAFHAEEPQAWSDASESERESQSSGLGGEDCILEGKRFFLRGLVEIPVAGQEEPLQWGSWVELEPKSYDRFSELWDTEGRESEPPHAATLATALPAFLYEPTTLGLPVKVHTRPVGVRPLIEVVGQHPIAVEQHEGIGQERLEQIWSMLLHQD